MGARARRRIHGARRESGCLCPYCGQKKPFCWRCPCGFRMCSSCMEENLWGMTCNQVVWTCPECGRQRPYGNQ